MGSLPNMVRSLVVVLALVAGLVLLVPRQESVVQPPVDVAPVAARVRTQTGWPMLAPVGLPSTWRATSVRYTPSAGGLPTWHVGYVVGGNQYVALEQAQGADDEWVQEQTHGGRGGGRSGGRVAAGGRTWAKVDGTDGRQRSLVDRGSGATSVTTVVTGTAPYDVLASFATYLTPVAAAS